MPASARIAFFGGSFDPPHLGHLAVARAAREALHLDHVLFAPVGAQPLKPRGATASFADRLEMTRLAIAGDPSFELSLLDAPHATGAPNYTLDTLRTLSEHLPGAELFLLLGADSFALLSNWHGAAEIPFAASLVVASRPGQDIGNLAAFLPAGLSLSHATTSAELHAYTLKNGSGKTAEFYLLPGLDVPISASQIRAQTRAGAPSPLPEAVADYIRDHGLYQQQLI
jgi:nicotinate-nucleotide adenylyltransferase